jgi:hypothetical protein
MGESPYLRVGNRKRSPAYFNLETPFTATGTLPLDRTFDRGEVR